MANTCGEFVSLVIDTSARRGNAFPGTSLLTTNGSIEKANEMKVQAREENTLPHAQTLALHPAAFPVILLGAGMQRRGQACRNHFFRIQVGKRRVKPFEPIEVVEYRFHDLIDDFIINICRRNEGSAHTKGLLVVRVTIERQMHKVHHHDHGHAMVH